MNPIKVKIGTYGRNTLRLYSREKGAWKERQGNHILWQKCHHMAHHPSISMGNLSVSNLPLNIFCVASSNNTNTEKLVTVVTSTVLSHRPHVHPTMTMSELNPLNPELNPICYLLALLGAHHFLHVSRIRVKSLTLRLLMSYIYGASILDVSRSHTTTQHSR